MTIREKIIRQFAFLSLLVSVVLTAMVFNQPDRTEKSDDSIDDTA